MLITALSFQVWLGICNCGSDVKCSLLLLLQGLYSDYHDYCYRGVAWRLDAGFQSCSSWKSRVGGLGFGAESLTESSV